VSPSHPELQNWAGGTYFEANKIDRNKLQIRTNWQKGTGTKMAEKSDFRPVLNPDTSWWLVALDSLTIGLVANKYTKLGKTSENLILMPYPCSHFYFDINFGDRLYSKEKRSGSTLLFWI
jgi:hypothetical protein